MKNKLINLFRGISLRQRFLIAPLLGLVVCSLLTAAFIYESQRQNALLSRITERDLTAFNRYAEVFVNLTEQHTALYDLLFRAGNSDEATLYDKTKQHLYQVHQGVQELEQALPPISKSVAPGFAALRNELSANAQAYRKGVSAAVEMATLDVELAPAQLVRANARFTAMYRSFVQLLELERKGISSEIAVRVHSSQVSSVTIVVIGILSAALLFILSIALSRVLASSIEKQIGILTSLGTQAGARFTVEGDDEVERMIQAIAAFRRSLLELTEKRQKLDYLAYYDALTGLANRSLFLDRVAQYVRSAAGGGHKLALYLIDLERFKNINDSLGRPAGDELLRQVAEWLTRNAGDAGLLARVGSDHFAVVLPEVKQDGDVARLLEKMLEAFLAHPFRLNDAVFRIAAKVGVAVFPDDGANADTLFKNAEAALKKAKASGDRYLFYTQKMTATVASKLTLETQLRQALDKGEFVLHYQPKVNLASGKLTGIEALIRWNDPRTGLVPPGRFIPILEETGLIYDVGRWALKQAIEDYLRWRAEGLAAVRIAVNVSPLQLRNHGFTAEIGQVIGIDAHAAAGLELEITESLIMEDVKHSIASLQAIRAMGVTIAIDDFGTGFSSLSYLAKLPVDTLKIDRSFVIDMTAGPQGLALVSTIIGLAHSLKLKVVAEGVETGEQRDLLKQLQCNEMQGYLFSKPVPAEQVPAFFDARP